MTYPFYIVDVFAERRYAGNQLAVVICTKILARDVMQQLAAEFNFSETSFVYITQEHDGAYPVKLFTPAREIAFAGHAILGTGWVIRERLTAAPAAVRIRLTVGTIPVTFEQPSDGAQIAWFHAPKMNQGRTCERELVAAALGVSPTDIAVASPIQEMTAGVSVLIVPLRNLDALRRCRLDLDAFAPLARQGYAPLVYVFCEETRSVENDLSARFFFEADGIREDPATGNGAAFLGGYLLEHRLVSFPSLTLRIEQGYEVNRPSLVHVRASAVAGVCDVHVGGGIIPIVSGELLP